MTAIYSDSPSVGTCWVPIKINNKNEAKALSIWLNSTPVRIMLFNKRSKILDYPKWSKSHLKEVRIPAKENKGWNVLLEAFEKVKDIELQPLKNYKECKGRKIIDTAAAVCLGIKPEIVHEWCDMLSKEPTISGREVLLSDVKK